MLPDTAWISLCLWDKYTPYLRQNWVCQVLVCGNTIIYTLQPLDECQLICLPLGSAACLHCSSLSHKSFHIANEFSRFIVLSKTNENWMLQYPLQVQTAEPHLLHVRARQLILTQLSITMWATRLETQAALVGEIHNKAFICSWMKSLQILRLLRLFNGLGNTQGTATILNGLLCKLMAFLFPCVHLLRET